MTVIKGLDSKADAVETQFEKSIAGRRADSCRIAFDCPFRVRRKREGPTQRLGNLFDFVAREFRRCPTADKERVSPRTMPRTVTDFVRQRLQILGSLSAIDWPGNEVTVGTLTHAERDMDVNGELATQFACASSLPDT